MSQRDREHHRTIEALGFVLVRQRKHRIYRHPCGAQLTCSVSSSDHHSVKNSLSLAKRLLRQAGVNHALLETL